MILAHLNVERFRLKIVWNFVYNKKQIRRNFVGYSGFALFVCGEGGIRTPGGVTLNGFQDRRDRPLCHLSLLPLPFPARLRCKVNTFFSFCKIFLKLF